MNIKYDDEHMLCTNNMKVILIATLSLVVLGCSTDQLDCYVADSIKLLDSTQENEVTYSLVLRITGLSDKVTFVELYQGVPSFDACGKSKLRPVYGDAVDKLESNLVKVENNQLRFVKPNPDLPITFESLRFVK